MERGRVMSPEALRAIQKFMAARAETMLDRWIAGTIDVAVELHAPFDCPSCTFSDHPCSAWGDASELAVAWLAGRIERMEGDA